MMLLKKGVKHAPAVIPIWHDMVPDSPFIRSVFSRKIKPDIPFYLLFSHKGNCSMFMDNNDGAVTIKSQLDPRAQADAISMWGFNNGHLDILSSPDVLVKYREILNNTNDK